MKMELENSKKGTLVQPVSLRHFVFKLLVFRAIVHSLIIHTNIDFVPGEANLSGKYDVVRVELQPPEQYKSVRK